MEQSTAMAPAATSKCFPPVALCQPEWLSGAPKPWTQARGNSPQEGKSTGQSVCKLLTSSISESVIISNTRATTFVSATLGCVMPSKTVRMKALLSVGRRKLPNTCGREDMSHSLPWWRGAAERWGQLWSGSQGSAGTVPPAQAGARAGLGWGDCSLSGCGEGTAPQGEGRWWRSGSGSGHTWLRVGSQALRVARTAGAAVLMLATDPSLWLLPAETWWDPAAGLLVGRDGPCLLPTIRGALVHPGLLSTSQPRIPAREGLITVISLAVSLGRKVLGRSSSSLSFGWAGVIM